MSRGAPGSEIARLEVPPDESLRRVLFMSASAIAEEADHAKTAFGNAFSFGTDAGSSVFSVPLAQVPVGKRLVLELVSLWCTATRGSFVSSAVLNVGQNV